MAGDEKLVAHERGRWSVPIFLSLGKQQATPSIAVPMVHSYLTRPVRFASSPVAVLRASVRRGENMAADLGKTELVFVEDELWTP